MKPYQPDVGDDVEFYNEYMERWEPGTVFDRGARRRLYWVQPYDEEQQTAHVVEYTHIRPVTDTEQVKIPSFWEAAKKAVRQRNVWQALSVEDAERALKFQAQIDAFPYETGAPVGDKVAARIAEYRERAEKAEADRDRFRSDLHQEMARSGKLSSDLVDALDKVETLKYTSAIPDGSAAGYKARAEKAEVEHTQCLEVLKQALRNAIADRQEADNLAAAAEARVEELEDQNRILKADCDQLKIERDEAWRAKGRAETGELFAKSDLAELKRHVASQKAKHHPQDNQVPQAVRDNDDDWWELNHDTGMYECGRYSYALTDIATVFGIKERIY